MSNERKGFLTTVMGTDCTNGGVTSGKKEAVVINMGVELFHPSNIAPALMLIVDDAGGARPGMLNVKKKDNTVHRVRAVPVDEDDNPVLGGMFGGQWIHASDSRFPFETPIPVHDRFETRSWYE